MKVLSASGVVSGIAATLTNDEIIALLGLIITILNIIIEYLRHKKEKEREREP